MERTSILHDITRWNSPAVPIECVFRWRSVKYTHKHPIINDMFRRMLALVFTSMAAEAAGRPCPEVKAEPVEEGSLIRIWHNQPQPLTAFLIEIVDYPGNRFAHMEDE